MRTRPLFLATAAGILALGTALPPSALAADTNTSIS